MPDAIESFLDEVREAGKVRGLINDGHIGFLESMLVSLHEAADENGALMDLWDSVRAIISDKSKSVKERLARFDPLGDWWNEQLHGRAN
jgi:hypothetical protein